MAQGNEMGRRIAEARRESGLTQEALAGLTEFTLSSVRGWEYGAFHPRPATLRKIAEVTGRSVAWFYEPESREAA